MGRLRDNRIICMIALALVIGTLVVFAPALRNGFVYDDEQYLDLNPNVQQGLSARSVLWAFRSTYAGNWHPLTWISHMVDCTLYGMKPSGHHMTGLLIHSANVLLLFLVLVRLTASRWRSAFVAALFAVHPLRLESVVWVAERKDVLSGLFWMLVMWAYARYAERPGAGRYALVLLFFACGLMSKPMVVTLPFVLLLLDYWPLGRFAQLAVRDAHSSVGVSTGARLALEKTPLVLLAAASSIVTCIAQQAGGAVQPFGTLPPGTRIANALVSYAGYIRQTLWPAGLGAFYPYPEHARLAWKAVPHGALLLCISVLVFLAARRRPYLVFGWLWYLGTLVPVIGLIQVGGQAMADRYTYIPIIGIFLAVAWGIPELLRCPRRQVGKAGQARPSMSRGSTACRQRAPGDRRPSSVLPLAAGLCLAGLAIATWVQIPYWRDNVTLFSRALRVTVRNAFAHNTLGLALAKQGKADQAVAHYNRALKLAPRYAGAHVNLGVTLGATGRLQEAMEHYMTALEIDPNSAVAHNNLGVALARTGDFRRAKDEFREAIRLDPTYQPARRNLKRAEDALKSGAGALFQPRGVADDSGAAEEHYRSGLSLAAQGKLDDAVAEYREAVRLKPEHASAWNALGVTLSDQTRLEEAAACYRKSLAIEVAQPAVHANLAGALYLLGRYAEARREIELCRHYGGTPNPRLVELLSAKRGKP